jgi:hypothetical protein
LFEADEIKYFLAGVSSSIIISYGWSKDNAMKNFLFYLVVLTVSCIFFSCKKDANNRTSAGTPTLVGNWTIVNDSTLETPWGLFDGRPSNGANYIGKAGDSYNFEPDGNLYIKEGVNKDTATYLTHLNLIRIGYTYFDGAPANPYPGVEFVVKNLTAHTVTLADTAVSPEIIYTETINLKR